MAVYFLLISMVIGGGAEYLIGFFVGAGSEGVTAHDVKEVLLEPR